MNTEIQELQEIAVLIAEIKIQKEGQMAKSRKPQQKNRKEKIKLEDQQGSSTCVLQMRRERELLKKGLKDISEKQRTWVSRVRGLMCSQQNAWKRAILSR